MNRNFINDIASYVVRWDLKDMKTVLERMNSKLKLILHPCRVSMSFSNVICINYNLLYVDQKYPKCCPGG